MKSWISDIFQQWKLEFKCLLNEHNWKEVKRGKLITGLSSCTKCRLVRRDYYPVHKEPNCPVCGDI